MMKTIYKRLSRERLDLSDNTFAYWKIEEHGGVTDILVAEIVIKGDSPPIPICGFSWFEFTDIINLENMNPQQLVWQNYRSKLNELKNGHTDKRLTEIEMLLDLEQPAKAVNVVNWELSREAEVDIDDENVQPYVPATVANGHFYDRRPASYQTGEQFIEAKKREYSLFREALLQRKIDAAIRKYVKEWERLHDQQYDAEKRYHEWLRSVGEESEF